MSQPLSQADRAAAFVQLHTKHQARIHCLIVSLVGDWNDADDLMQETAAVMWNKFETYTPGTNFLAWAFRIARFNVMNHLAKKARHDKHLTEANVDRIVQAHTQLADETDDRRQALRGCLSKLNERDQQILAERYADGGSAKQVAESMDRSVFAIHKALNRIHHSLLVCIRQSLPGTGGPA